MYREMLRVGSRMHTPAASSYVTSVVRFAFRRHAVETNEAAIEELTHRCVIPSIYDLSFPMYARSLSYRGISVLETLRRASANNSSFEAKLIESQAEFHNQKLELSRSIGIHAVLQQSAERTATATPMLGADESAHTDQVYSYLSLS